MVNQRDFDKLWWGTSDSVRVINNQRRAKDVYPTDHVRKN